MAVGAGRIGCGGSGVGGGSTGTGWCAGTGGSNCAARCGETSHPLGVAGRAGSGTGGGGGGAGLVTVLLERSLSLRARADFCCWRFRRRDDAASFSPSASRLDWSRSACRLAAPDGATAAAAVRVLRQPASRSPARAAAACGRSFERPARRPWRPLLRETAGGHDGSGRRLGSDGFGGNWLEDDWRGGRVPRFPLAATRTGAA